MYNIEIYELGYWESIDVIDNLDDALILASVQCNNYPDYRVRIVCPDGKIL